MVLRRQCDTGGGAADLRPERDLPGRLRRHRDDRQLDQARRLGLRANGSWRLRGNSAITADFGAARIDGTLTPTYWEKFDGGRVVQVTPGTGQHSTFTDADIVLKGSIKGNGITGASYLQRNEARERMATEQPDFVNGDNPMHGGFYGAKADNVTGVFATYARLPAPGGAGTGINDDRRGTVDMQGMFNAQCVANCVK